MNTKQALKAAQAIVGPKAAVEMLLKGARIGTHGEYLKSHDVNNRKDSPKQGRYRCDRCSTAEVVDADFVERAVWHLAGGTQAAYRIGRVDLGMFFTVLAEGESFEACLAKLHKKPVAVFA